MQSKTTYDGDPNSIKVLKIVLPIIIGILFIFMIVSSVIIYVAEGRKTSQNKILNSEGLEEEIEPEKRISYKSE